ncbi:hypothetical protein [Acetobacter indonesiensis]|nr:hypothetical protein [Acetobacter indonesiensis]
MTSSSVLTFLEPLCPLPIRSVDRLFTAFSPVSSWQHWMAS